MLQFVVIYTVNVKDPCYDYTVEVTNRFKELDLIGRVPEELWTEVHDIVQETGIKTIPKKKTCRSKSLQVINAGLEETQAGIKIAGRNINNLRYADDTNLWQKVK